MRSLPPNLAESAREMIDDPELLSLRAEMAVVGARAAALIEDAHSASADGAGSGRARKALEAFRDAKRRGDGRGQQAAIVEMIAAVESATAAEEKWDRAMACFEQFRKLQQAEVQRLAELKKTLTAEQAVNVIGVVMATFARHVMAYASANRVADKDLLAAVSQDLRQLVLSRPELGRVGELQQVPA